MKIVILGVGKVGATLIESFIDEGHDVAVIDRKESNVKFAVNSFDTNGIVGDALERKVLSDAGVAEADFFIACTSRDETNILCCVLAKKLGAKRTIARVRDPHYYKEMDNLKEFLGLDLTFNPEFRASCDILNVLKFPSAKSVESFAGGKALLAEFDVTLDNPMKGKTLMQIKQSLEFQLLVCMVKRGEKYFVPRGDFTVQENDSIFIIATEQELTKFCKKLKIFKPHAKNVMIIGGGKVAYYLASALTANGVSVKILENDKTRCAELSEAIPDATVLYGDGTDQAVLNEEGLKKCDACATLTGIDEENIIISLYAKECKVHKVITKIDRSHMKDMVNRLGLETVISPRNSIASHIIRFVRSNGETEFSGINSLYKLNDSVEVAEITLDDGFEGLNVPLSKLKIRKEVLIGGIVRGDEFILPVGDTEFMVGDKVIVVTSENRITQPNGILK